MRTLRCLAEYSVLAPASFTLAPAAAPLDPALVEGPVRVIFPRNPGELAMCGRLPFGKGEFLSTQVGRVLPCVRPVGAARVAAGPNAMRGSVPIHKRAL